MDGDGPRTLAKRKVVCLRLDASDIEAMRAEAHRQLVAGIADRLDYSRVVRLALRAYVMKEREK